MGLFSKVFGTRSQREVKALTATVDKIEALEEEYRALSDRQLRAKTDEFQSRLAGGETLDGILPEAFATVREAAVPCGCWASGPTGCSSSAASSSTRAASPR